MQLFKSEWMFEPMRARGAIEWSRPCFSARYGVSRTTAVRTVCPPLPALDETPVLATIEHERAVLRALARYDRAA